VSAQQKNGKSPLTSVAPNNPHIVLFGRYDNRDPSAPRFGYPGTGISLRFRGTSIALLMTSNSDTSAITLVVDHGNPTLALLHKGENIVRVARGLDNSVHTLQLYKRNETWQGVITFKGVQPGKAILLVPVPLPVRKLMFLGDSITCGAGVDNNATCTNAPAHPASNPYYSYGMVLGRRLDAQADLVCFGGRGVERDYRGLGSADGVLNAPQFLDLAVPTDDSKGRALWNNRSWTPDGIIVSLGTNDFYLEASRPLDEKTFVADYAALLRHLVSEYPKATIFATEGPMVTSPLLRKYVHESVDQVHDSRVIWMKATHYSGNGCNPHPTLAQHVRMADDIEPVLRSHLHW
jgi:lysophospholipase L1-like esterase